MGENMSKKQRIYFVIDMKSFFASVECAERKIDAMEANLVVADSERTEKTICLAVSSHLKSLGVKNRCRLYEIPKNLDYIIAKPRMKKYIEYSAEIYAIYLKYIDKNDIHIYSIDECFIDATDYLSIYNINAKDFALKLMTEIKEKLGIPSSVGIGTNMYLAKIALDITAKRSADRVGYLDEQKFINDLWKHKPLSDFWGISSGTSARLACYGIFDMEGIAKADEDLLYREFGINAELLIDHSWGRETCLIEDIKNYQSKSKSISSSQILPCNYNYTDALIVMKEMVQNGCYELFRLGYVTNLIHLYIGYGDKRDEGVKGMARLTVNTNLYYLICPMFSNIFEKIVDKSRPIRKIGFDFADILPMEYEKYDLFTDLKKVEKEKKLIKSLIFIKLNFGKNSVLKGLDFKKNATIKDRNKMIGGHNE